ncbi:MAG: hypothetical protein AAB425_11185, partial [Bdellovibrionota bacterium]
MGFTNLVVLTCFFSLAIFSGCGSGGDEEILADAFDPNQPPVQSQIEQPGEVPVASPTPNNSVVVPGTGTGSSSSGGGD